MDHVTVFIDHQNAYHGARRAFFDDAHDPYVLGQFQPMDLARLICERKQPGTDPVLHEVRVYSGLPSASKDGKSYSARMKQMAGWKKQGATEIHRPVRYPHGWPDLPAQEKGIDVSLAVDFVAGAIDGAYDIGVIMSADTDITPALEYVAKKKGLPVLAQVAAWRTPSMRARIGTGLVWCHFLDRTDYDRVADTTDYNR